MSTNPTLTIAPDEFSPKFVRGQTFSFRLELPPQVQVNQLAGYDLTSQLRRLHNAGPQGLITDLTVNWSDETCTAIDFLAENTEAWPLGPAEFDVRFINATTGRKIRSLPVQFEIVEGITP